MKLYVTGKPFSIHNKLAVKDENNSNLYEISSQIFFNRKKHITSTIKDVNGNSIAYIEQEQVHLHDIPGYYDYNIYIHNEFKFKISKELQLLKNNYLLSNGYKVTGNFRMLDFEIYDEKNNKIGGIKRTTGFFSIGGSEKYELDIIDSNQREIILTIFVVITYNINRITSNGD